MAPVTVMAFRYGSSHGLGLKSLAPRGLRRSQLTFACSKSVRSSADELSQEPFGIEANQGAQHVRYLHPMTRDKGLQRMQLLRAKLGAEKQVQ